jgi:hypothetical protein
MPEMAHLIELKRVGQKFELLIDGQPFPWYVELSPIEVRVDPYAAPRVRLTIVADRVELTDAGPTFKEPPA